MSFPVCEGRAERFEWPPMQRSVWQAVFSYPDTQSDLPFPKGNVTARKSTSNFLIPVGGFGLSGACFPTQSPWELFAHVDWRSLYQRGPIFTVPDYRVCGTARLAGAPGSVSDNPRQDL